MDPNIEEVFAIITFHSTHFAVKAKNVLERHLKRPEIIAVPRQFSSDCGFCCKMPWSDRDETERILMEHRIEIDQIFRWERGRGKSRMKNGRCNV